jgi:hypothetical protein
MPEPLKANLTPINLLAKKHLNQLNWSPDPHHLYCLQLAQWALFENKVDLHWRADRLPEYVNSFLSGGDPEKVADFLEGEHNMLYDVDPKVSAEELASVILEHLHDRLVAEMDYYP